MAQDLGRAQGRGGCGAQAEAPGVLHGAGERLSHPSSDAVTCRGSDGHWAELVPIHALYT